MKFGVFSVSMPEYDLEETVKTLKELGYDGVEWRVQNMPAQEPEDIPFDRRYWIYNKSTIDLPRVVELAQPVRTLCEKYGIEIFGLTSYLTPDKKEEIEQVLKAAQIMGTKQIRVFTPGYSDDPGHRPYPELFEETAAHTAALEPLARQYGVKIVFEIHMDNLLASPSAAMRLVSRFDPRYIGIIYDPGNMVYEGFENYQKSFELLGDYIAHVHVKNALLAEDGRDDLGALRWKREWAPLKEGMANLNLFFKVLKANGYDGNVSVEDFSNAEPTYDKLKNNLAYIKALAENA